MKIISFLFLGFLTFLFSSCSQQVEEYSVIDYVSHSTRTSFVSSSFSSISDEELTIRWMDEWDIDVSMNDSLYGLNITAIDRPEIHLQGALPIAGVLEWGMYYARPALFFLPDIKVPEKYQREFVVENSEIFPTMRQGVKVQAIVEDMTVVFMESSKPSTVLLKSIEKVGAVYETISETDEEWQYYMKWLSPKN